MRLGIDLILAGRSIDRHRPQSGQLGSLSLETKTMMISILQWSVKPKENLQFCKSVIYRFSPLLIPSRTPP